MLTLKFLAAAIFIITGGAVFTGWFKNHRVLAVLAALVSIAAAYYFLRDVVRDVMQEQEKEQTERSPQPVQGNDTIREGPAAPQNGADPAITTLEVRDAWAAPTPGGIDVSAGYLTIANGGPADTLVAVSSPRAASVMIHEMSMDGAVMRMRSVEGGLAIPAQDVVTLAPSGGHLMFMGVSQPFVEGEEIPVTLTFAGAGVRDVMLPVRAAR